MTGPGRRKMKKDKEQKKREGDMKRERETERERGGFTSYLVVYRVRSS